MNHVYERNVSMTTRDGVILRADVWRPLEGTAPTLLMRLPYGRQTPTFYGGPGVGIPSLIAFRYDPRDPVPTAGGALLPSLPGHQPVRRHPPAAVPQLTSPTPSS
jgi:hypothetical protein